MTEIDRNSKIPIKLDAFVGNSILVQSAHIFVCSICGRNFGSSAHLYMEHMKERHGMNCSIMPLEGKEFCDE